MEDNNELIIPKLNKETIEGMVYEIRGQKVMLDFDLARIYGYETKRLNEQVRRNINKFPAEFMFKLEKQEIDNIERSQFATTELWAAGKGGRVYLPTAFTEQGVYMLMTVLKGDLATQQTKILIRTFKQMKDYIVASNNLLSTDNVIKLVNQVNENTSDINEMKNKLEIVMDNFIDPNTYKEFLILNGEKIEADIAYQNIFKLAKSSIYIIDDYVNLKTLQLLKCCNPNIEIIIFTDNKNKNGLNINIVNDFIHDTNMNIKLKQNGKSHDRYIFIDYNTNNFIVYHSGGSIKDAGNKITTIDKAEYPYLYENIVLMFLNNEDLNL